MFNMKTILLAEAYLKFSYAFFCHYDDIVKPGRTQYNGNGRG
jgi:hypothetical protein